MKKHTRTRHVEERGTEDYILESCIFILAVCWLLLGRLLLHHENPVIICRYSEGVIQAVLSFVFIFGLRFAVANASKIISAVISCLLDEGSLMLDCACAYVRIKNHASLEPTVFHFL